MLKENLEEVEEKIAKACEHAGRAREEVTLIAVSKTKPVEMLQEIYDEGIRDFGENKVQELTEKYEVMPKDMKWHMIGHLQRNKVKYIVDKVTLIHSVDSLRLAETISREAEKKGVTVPILIEVNIAGEETKFGLSSKEEVISLTEQIAALPNLSVKGLMTVAPPVKDPEENRPFFREIRQLSVDITNKNIDNVSMEILSMGMTNDYTVAIEEGATMVRVGTGIFGARDYSKK
jgi:pyridoxal phosphate enzyme (YggS family)